MSDWLLTLVPTYGVWLIAITTYFACLGLPLPSTIVMVAAGGFIASGDIAMMPAILGAYAGLVAGNQSGYFIGRWGAHLAGNALDAKPVVKARNFLAKRGVWAVFLSRWLVSPTGPFVNYAAGLTPLAWKKYTLASTMGEIIWLALYLGLGYVFLGNLSAISDILFNGLGVIALGAMTIGLGWWLWLKVKAARLSANDESGI